MDGQALLALRDEIRGLRDEMRQQQQQQFDEMRQQQQQRLDEMRQQQQQQQQQVSIFVINFENWESKF
jgi:DNA anti-recombination protein RmuC